MIHEALNHRGWGGPKVPSFACLVLKPEVLKSIDCRIYGVYIQLAGHKWYLAGIRRCPHTYHFFHLGCLGLRWVCVHFHIVTAYQSYRTGMSHVRVQLAWSNGKHPPPAPTPLNDPGKRAPSCLISLCGDTCYLHRWHMFGITVISV